MIDEFCRLVSGLLIKVHTYNSRAFGGKQCGRLPTDTASSSCDQGKLDYYATISLDHCKLLTYNLSLFDCLSCWMEHL